MVRKTKADELDIVMSIYDDARERMRVSGNHAQWINGYPSRELILADINAGISYVIEDAGDIVGVFTFIPGDEPTYKNIDGTWPDDNPYGTIHRIAGRTGSHGIADTALDFCLTKGIGIRIDTHADNAPMLSWIAKRGFRYCGIIHVSDGSPRKAFQL